MKKIIKKVGIWGDSILKGVIFDEAVGKYRATKRCAVNLFSRIFSSVDIKNNSRFGCTAPKAEVNLENSLDKGFSADAVLLEFGGNDCDFNWIKVSQTPHAEHMPNTPLPQFIHSMKKMINSLVQHNIKPILVNLPPINADMYFEWISQMDGVNGDNVLYWLKDKSVIYRHQELYSCAIERMAYENNLTLINIREPFLQIRDHKSCLCVDGIHPNERGQAIIYDTFKKYAITYSTA